MQFFSLQRSGSRFITHKSLVKLRVGRPFPLSLGAPELMEQDVSAISLSTSHKGPFMTAGAGAVGPDVLPTTHSVASLSKGSSDAMPRKRMRDSRLEAAALISGLALPNSLIANILWAISALQSWKFWLIIRAKNEVKCTDGGWGGGLGASAVLDGCR